MKLKRFALVLLCAGIFLAACSENRASERREKRKMARVQPVPKPDVTAGELIGNWFRVNDLKNEGVQFFNDGYFISFKPIQRGQWKLTDSLLVLETKKAAEDSTGKKNSYVVHTYDDGSIGLQATAGVDSVRLRKYEVKLEFDRWLGYWPGPDSTGLLVSPAEGKYLIQIITNDSSKLFEATPTSQGLKFTREGREEFLRAGSGFDTGIKDFLERGNCLYIRKEEGFCRESA